MNENDKTPYGKELATQVADYVATHRLMVNTHRDYCGLGLGYWQDLFFITTVYDGWPFLGNDTFSFFANNEYDAKLHAQIAGGNNSWSSKKELIVFLTEQSDFSFSGEDKDSVFFEHNESLRNNQRITRAFLNEHLAQTEGSVNRYQMKDVPQD